MLRLITIPPNWTPEQDVDYYQDRFGEAHNYFASVLELVAESYEELTATVDRALDYFERHDGQLIRVHPGTLALPEKIYRLSGVIGAGKRDYEYQERFADHLHECIFADAERQRVMQDYYNREGRKWLKPLCDASDYLATASGSLDEGMACEHEDYNLPVRRNP